MFTTVLPQAVFALLALLFGLIFVFATPPFQAPDEYAHFYRAYQISEGGFIARLEDRRVGGNLPVSVSTVTAPFRHLIFNPETRTSRADFAAAWRVRLNPDQRDFIDFNNTALSSPAPYLHQAAAIAVARLLSDRPLLYLYAARLSNLLLWIACLLLALHLVPAGKWILAALALMPTSLFLAASMSYDTFTNAVSFLTVALALRCALASADEPIGLRHIAALSLAGVALALSKFAYLPLIGLFFLTPKLRFESTERWIRTSLAVLLPGIVAWLLWVFIASSLYLPYEEYNEVHRVYATFLHDVSIHDQLRFLLHSPHRFIVRLLISLYDQNALQSMIAMLGWMDTSFPCWFIAVWMALLGFTVLTDGCAEPALHARARLFLLSIAGLSLLGFFALLYMQWSPVAWPRILGIHGRYMIPLAPAVLLGISHAGRFQLSNSTTAKLIVAAALTASCLMAIAVLIQTLLPGRGLNPVRFPALHTYTYHLALTHSRQLSCSTHR